ncbi:hypothetical protein AVEN_72064-1 [Araneus ventricosus]|uniref:Uncharacterized protein n=1 Tax=Araneus ventricosus TaxID=182803 RepID=A0A4Y2VDG9_ARAVE|nr:hypothetical protein AVEN_76551-1 [Araneus ventricosus]GBO21730.1 hypothetical protein AVEN_72064-1 [Araneus ventricosus]
MTDVETGGRRRAKGLSHISFALWFLAFIPAWIYVVFWIVLILGGWLMDKETFGFCLKGVGSSLLWFLVFFAIYFLFKKYCDNRTKVRRADCRENRVEDGDNGPQEADEKQPLLRETEV